MSIEGEIKEPLLPSAATSTKIPSGVAVNDNLDEDNVSEIHFLRQPSCVWRLQQGSFLTGSIVAVLSQVILSFLFWNENVLQACTWEVIQFSFVWSIYTCAILFGTMVLLVRCIHRWCHAASLPRSDWDDIVFRVEAHHIVGALLSITLSWIIVDLTRLTASHNNDAQNINGVQMYTHAMMAALGYLAALVILIAGRQCQSEQDSNKCSKDSPLMDTYQLLASTLGFVVGLCSQFLLSACLWRDHLTHPVIGSIVLFSLLWSFATVLITFGGCYALRFLAVDVVCSESSSNAGAAQMARIHLRMESSYVLAALVGICLSWILVDCVLGLPEQVLPSLAMLGIALLAFRCILYCFPEDECVQEYCQQLSTLQQQQQMVKVCHVIASTEESDVEQFAVVYTGIPTSNPDSSST
jgi:hypothetical protein